MKRNKKTKQYKFEIHCTNIKPVIKLLQGKINIFEVADITKKYKKICTCNFDMQENSVGFSIPKDSNIGIPSDLIPVMKTVVISYYRGMLLSDVVHVWYTIPLVKTKFDKYQPEVV